MDLQIYKLIHLEQLHIIMQQLVFSKVTFCSRIYLKLGIIYNNETNL